MHDDGGRFIGPTRWPQCNVGDEDDGDDGGQIFDDNMMEMMDVMENGLLARRGCNNLMEVMEVMEGEIAGKSF
jgi:hypothetical protein